jgi:Zn-dependent peptidase ImmA (M78 family)
MNILNSLKALERLKSRWKVSIAAIGRRLRDLNLISENQFTYINIQLSTEGYRKREPLDDVIPMEKPTLLENAFKALKDHELLTVSKAIEDLFISPEDFFQVTGLPKEMMEKTTRMLFSLYRGLL